MTTFFSRRRLLNVPSRDVAQRLMFRHWQLWILLAGLVVRVLFVLTISRENSFAGWDGKEYYAYAESLVALHGDNYSRYFMEIRPPFYPIFLVPFVALSRQVWPIQIVQSLIGVFQAYVLGKIARQWRGERAGNVALMLALFNPFLIYYCGFILTETLFITLLWVGMLCLQHVNDGHQISIRQRWMVAGGVVLALACLTRPTLQPFLIITVFWIGWREFIKRGRLVALKQMAIFTIVVSTFLVPPMLRNYQRYGELSLAPKGTSLMYAMGNSPNYLQMYKADNKDKYYEIWGELVSEVSVEGAKSGKLTAASQEFRQKDRRDWILLEFYKFQHFWTPWVNPIIFSKGQFLLSFVSATPLFFLGLAELWRQWRARDTFLPLIVGLVFVGYLVGGFLFHVQVRYRIPFVDTAFLLLTASLLAHLHLKHNFKRMVLRLNDVFRFG